MHSIKSLAVAVLALGLAASPALARDLSPVGTWQSSDGETRVAVTMCGDGTQLCAELTWLRDDQRTPQNLRLLNANVVDGARPVAENAWKGRVRFNGQSATGTIELVSNQVIEVSGCKLGMCRSFQFNRI